MKNYILKNGMKLIYKHTNSMLSSISIALDAGAIRDTKGKLGIAHATEHMIYKGTKNRSEAEINRGFSEIFGFQNAMTNYPYVIYYGTLLSEDLNKGIELYSDLLINTSLGVEGFEEEMKIIKEELKEWDEEVEQFCEDKLFFNCYEERRLKYPIIGTEESLDSITFMDVKEFYNKYYFPKNTTIVIVSSINVKEVMKMVEEHFGVWNKDNKLLKEIENEKSKNIIYSNKKDGINTCKVLITYDISHLNYEEIKILKILNQYLGEGVNSLLFDTLRTKKALVYDVLTKVSNEKHIGLYKISFSTAEENIEETLKCINDLFENLEEKIKELSKEDIEGFIKSFKLKRLFNEEQSIRLSNAIAMYDIMFKNYQVYLDEIENLNYITKKHFKYINEKVFKEKSVEIITKN